MQDHSIGSTSVHCPSGTKVIGGGADVVGKNTATVLSESYPFDDGDAGHTPDDGWRATLVSRSQSSKKLIAFAICATRAKLSYISTGLIPLTPGGRQTLYAACPDGTSVTSGGASLQLHHTDLVDIAGTKPFDGADDGDIPDNGWQTTYDNATAGFVNGQGFAICSGVGTYFYSDTPGSIGDGSGGGQLLGLSHDCGLDAKVVGGGVTITATGGPDDFEVTGSFPSDGADANTRHDDNWQGWATNFSAGARTMDLFVVCHLAIF